MLVLGMASIANATVLSWSTSAITITAVGSTVVVQISANDNMPYDKYLGGSASTVIADITNVAKRAAAGPDAVVTANPSGWTGKDWWRVQAIDFTPPNDISAGVQWDVTISGLATGSRSVVSDYYGNPTGMLQVTVLPEPMTIALLGLGGLLMLRRRK